MTETRDNGHQSGPLEIGEVHLEGGGPLKKTCPRRGGGGVYNGL